MQITERYASSLRSGNLGSKPETTFSDSDVLGAYGLAAKRHPLSIALQRLLLGDHSSAGDVVNVLAENACGKAYRLGMQVERVELIDIARAVVAWCRSPACPSCNGLGFRLVEGAPHLSGQGCTICRSTGRRPFDAAFQAKHLSMARWMCGEVERETSKAGQAAMAALAPRLYL